jgi:hypothetical protein
MTERSKFLHHFEKFISFYGRIIADYKNMMKKEDSRNKSKVRKLATCFRTFKEFHHNQGKNTEWYMKQFGEHYSSNAKHIIDGNFDWLEKNNVNISYKKNIKKTCLTLSGIYQIIKNRYPKELTEFKYYMMRLFGFVCDDENKERVYLEMSELIGELEDNDIIIPEYISGASDSPADLMSAFKEVTEQVLGDSALSDNLSQIFGDVFSSNTLPDGINAMTQAFNNNPEIFQHTQNALQGVLPQLVNSDMMNNIGSMMNNVNLSSNRDTVNYLTG